MNIAWTIVAPLLTNELVSLLTAKMLLWEAMIKVLTLYFCCMLRACLFIINFWECHIGERSTYQVLHTLHIFCDTSLQLSVGLGILSAVELCILHEEAAVVVFNQIFLETVKAPSYKALRVQRMIRKASAFLFLIFLIVLLVDVPEALLRCCWCLVSL